MCLSIPEIEIELGNLPWAAIGLHFVDNDVLDTDDGPNNKIANRLHQGARVYLFGLFEVLKKCL